MYTKINIKSIDDIFCLSIPVPFTGCWIWSRGVSGCGYAYVQKYGSIHRLSFRLFNGYDAHGLVCHTCDIKTCVNPRHLYDGTKSTNQKDAISRGQSKPPRKPSAIDDGDLLRIAEFMRNGLPFSRACEKAGKAYQVVQTLGRRERLNKMLEA